MIYGRYYIETYGCQMNDHDSEKMAAMLEGIGLTAAEDADAADVVVINTCSIRAKSEHKLNSAVGRLKGLKQRNPSVVTVVAGCVAQQEKERLLRRSEHLDIVLGTHHIAELPELVLNARERGLRVAKVDFSADVESLHTGPPRRGAVCAYVTIMQGCSNFCAYCVVPYTRGPEQSRPASEIVEEVNALVDSGTREITLLGQNVNAYGKDRGLSQAFAELLEKLDAIPGLRRVRFTTSHPKDFSPELVRAIARLDSVCRHIHLPLQSGSDKTLQRMRRGYSFAQYMDKIRLLRDSVPGMAITTDIIVGFPGESEEDFAETMCALETIRYDQIFSFKYSPRPNTAAREFPEQIPEEVKIERLARVHAIQERITGDYHHAAEGTCETVLVERIRESGQAYGKSETNKVVNINGTGFIIGDLVEARIIRGLKHSLVAERE